MTMPKFSNDKRALLKSLARFDNGPTGGCLEVADSCSNTLLLQVLLEALCGLVATEEGGGDRLFQGVHRFLTKYKILDERIALDNLQPTRRKMASKFLKLMTEIHQSTVPSPAQDLQYLDVPPPKQQHSDRYSDTFEELKVIAEGGFGTVCMARHKFDGIIYAVKKIIFKYKNDTEYLKVIREARSIATLKHVNVVSYNSAWIEEEPPTTPPPPPPDSGSDEGSSSSRWGDSSRDSSAPPPLLDFMCPRVMLCIQMEYCDCDLRQWLDKRDAAGGVELPFERSESSILRDILEGVAHVHAHSIIHRDLKPQNIFFSVRDSVLKIGDFGLATLSPSPQQGRAEGGEFGEGPLSSHLGTLPYAAPEQRTQHAHYDTKADMWSVGVIVVEVAGGCGGTRMGLCRALDALRRGGQGAPLMPPHYAFVAENLLQADPAARMTAREVLALLPPPPHAEKCVDERAALIQRLMRKVGEQADVIARQRALIQRLQAPPGGERP